MESGATFDVIGYYAMAIIFIPGLVAGFIVYEREVEIK